MANGYRSHPVHTKELAYCEESPTKAHHWIQTVEKSPIFYCRYCSSFRAFNVSIVIYNPYSSDEFMKLFTLDSLPHLMSLIDRRHKDRHIEDSPQRPNYANVAVKSKEARRIKKIKVEGEFDRGPRRVVHNGIMKIFNRNQK